MLEPDTNKYLDIHYQDDSNSFGYSIYPIEYGKNWGYIDDKDSVPIVKDGISSENLLILKV